MVLPIIAAIFAIVNAMIVTTTHCRRLFLLPTLSLDVVFDYRRFLPLRLNIYGYPHRRRKGRLLPSPLATASIRNRHGCRNRTRQDRNPDACRNLSTLFSIDAVEFLPTSFVFYRCFLLPPFSTAIANGRQNRHRPSSLQLLSLFYPCFLCHRQIDHRIPHHRIPHHRVPHHLHLKERRLLWSPGAATFRRGGKPTGKTKTKNTTATATTTEHNRNRNHDRNHDHNHDRNYNHDRNRTRNRTRNHSHHA
jgi:hypothetical protein